MLIKQELNTTHVSIIHVKPSGFPTFTEMWISGVLSFHNKLAGYYFFFVSRVGKCHGYDRNIRVKKWPVGVKSLGG